jgi:DNA-binding NarL/FixJ family response regulator
MPLAQFRTKPRPLRVLLLEECAADAVQITDELGRAGLWITAERVTSADAFSRALQQFTPDIILVGHVPATFDAVGALAVVRGMRSAAPLIVVSGGLDAVSAVAAFKAGAEDVVLKSELGGLGAAVAAAIAVREPLEGLSPRQREVLCFMAQGRNTRAIADELGISVKTVEAHRSELMRRLGIRHVAGLTRYAVRVGLVAPDPADPGGL